jgi:hypothetical protein
MLIEGVGWVGCRNYGEAVKEELEISGGATVRRIVDINRALGLAMLETVGC